MKTFVDYVLDLETSGKRGWHGIRDKFNPPRITQFGLIEINQTDPTKFKTIIGAGPGGGWTDEISQLVKKYNIQSEMKIPAGFWRELAATHYDPSVVEKGSFLNNQVRDHVREFITLEQTGRSGDMKSAMDYIKQFQSSVDTKIASGMGVRINVYNKGFDVQQMIQASFAHSEETGQGFLGWLNKHVTSGNMQIRGIESNIHRGMFDVMMKDVKAVPRFVSSQYFQAAAEAGLKTVGMEATTPHYALREMVTDLSKIKGGADPTQVLKGLPKEMQKALGEVSTYDQWLDFKAGLKGSSPDVLMSHYRQKAIKKYGRNIAKHVKEMGFEFVAGWRSENAARILGMGPMTHRGLGDVVDEWKIFQATKNPAAAEGVAREMLTNEEVILREVNEKYLKWQQEVPGSTRPISDLMKIAKSKKPPPAGLSRLARSPFALPILAVAGGILLADQLDKNATPKRRVQAIREQMAGKIEGLRRSLGQWDQAQGGINPTNMGNNVSAFGSGRWDSVWASGSYRGAQIDPAIYYHRAYLNLHPELAYEEAQQRVQAETPTNYAPTHEEMNNQSLDLSDYIYEVQDGDSILLRKAWLNQKVPVIGPMLGVVQNAIMNASQALTGNKGGFEIRVSGLDAPEVEHAGYGANWFGGQQYGKESTEKMNQLMRGSGLGRIFGGRATHIQLKPGMTYGRYVGSPYAGSADIGQELVSQGGAIALSAGGDKSSYFGTEAMAANMGRGMWSHPEYQGILESRRRGINPTMSHLQKRTQLGQSLRAAAAYSMVAYAANPQQHGVRDQHSQNLFVRGY